MSLAVPVAVAFHRAVAPAIAKAAEKAGEFLIEHCFDGRANIRSQALLDRVKPGLPGQ